MTTVQLTVNLSDSLVEAAQQAGLFQPEAVEQMIREAVRKQRIDGFFSAADRLARESFPQMSFEEIQAEVNAVRASHQSGLSP